MLNASRKASGGEYKEKSSQNKERPEDKVKNKETLKETWNSDKKHKANSEAEGSSTSKRIKPQEDDFPGEKGNTKEVVDK